MIDLVQKIIDSLRGIARTRGSATRVLIMTSVAPLLAAICYTSFWLRLEHPPAFDRLMITRLSMLVAIKTAVFYFLHVYRGWSRHLTFHDLVVLVKAATLSSFVVLGVNYLVTPMRGIPRSVLLMDCAGTILVMGAVRALGRFVEEVQTRHRSRHGLNVLIIGTDRHVENLLRFIHRSPDAAYSVQGLVDKDPGTLGTRINGVPVVGNIDHIRRLTNRFEASEVLVMSGYLSGGKLRQVIEALANQNTRVRVLPNYQQLIEGKVALKPRTVNIEDLLRRDPVAIEQAELARWLNGRVLMVTGSAGSIGSEICRQLLSFEPRKIVLVDRSENGQFFLRNELRSLAGNTELAFVIADVADWARMESTLERYRPDVLFHAAAYKHVPLMEENPGEAIKNIVSMTKVIVDLAAAFHVRSFVMISTDKAVNPTSVMGACKRVAELYVQSMANEECRFVTVRFGNVLDSAGSVVPIFRQQIENGGPVTVTHPDMVRYFMTIPEASQLVIQAGAMGRGGEIFVLDMGDPVRIVDLATDMIRLSGLQPGRDIAVEFTGTRPGEKLFEELHLDDETHLATNHPKIMVASSRRSNALLVTQAIRQLEEVSDGDKDQIVARLQAIVPEFVPPNHQQQVVRRAA